VNAKSFNIKRACVIKEICSWLPHWLDETRWSISSNLDNTGPPTKSGHLYSLPVYVDSLSLWNYYTSSFLRCGLKWKRLFVLLFIRTTPCSEFSEVSKSSINMVKNY